VSCLLPPDEPPVVFEEHAPFGVVHAFEAAVHRGEEALALCGVIVLAHGRRAERLRPLVLAARLQGDEPRDAQDVAQRIGVLDLEPLFQFSRDAVERLVGERGGIGERAALEERDEAIVHASVRVADGLVRTAPQHVGERAPPIRVQRARGHGVVLSEDRTCAQHLSREMPAARWILLALALAGCREAKRAPPDAGIELVRTWSGRLSGSQPLHLDVPKGAAVEVVVEQRSADVALVWGGERIDRVAGPRGDERWGGRAPDGVFVLEKAHPRFDNGEVRLHVVTGTRAEARLELHRVLRAYETGTATVAASWRAPDDETEAELTLAEAVWRWERREVELAQAGLQSAIERAKSRRDIAARAHARLGDIAYFLGDLEAAKTHFDEALRGALAIDAATIELQARIGVAAVHSSKNEHDEALAVLEHVAAIAEGVGDDYSLAIAYDLTGTIYFRLGESRQARRYYVDSHDALARLNATQAQGRVLHKLGLLARELEDDIPAALDAFDRALPMLEDAKSVEGEALVHIDRGLTWFLRGERDAAKKALEQGYALSKRYRIQHLHGRAAWGLGVLANANGDHEAAVERFEEAVEKFDAVQDAIYEARAEGGLAQAWRSRGGAKEALEHAQRAVALAESVRARVRAPDLRTSAFADVRRTYELLLALRIATGASPLETLRVSERARARSLFEALQRARVADVALRSAIPDLSVPDLTRRLGRQGALVEYFLAEPRSWAWVVDADGVRRYELAGRAKIEAAVRAWRDAIEARGPEVDALGAPLSALIGAPLAKAPRDLWIVPDGALHYAPWAALPDGDGRALVEQHIVRLAPSAAFASRPARPMPEAPRIAIVADPVFSAADPRLETPDPAADVPFARLGFARSEADVIASRAKGRADRWQGVDANLALVRGGAFAGRDILHFATHAVVSPTSPERAALILSLVDADGTSREGALTLAHIYDLQLDARLVVLSACETALGEHVRGEGLLGLGRAFLFAGSHSVASSLWRVDDRATYQLMSRFYAELLGTHSDPARALRAAQLGLRADERYTHPRDWASFLVVGR
jgi:CHAT domain-containing protein